MLRITEYRPKFFHLATHIIMQDWSTFPLRFFNDMPLLLCYAALLFKKENQQEEVYIQKIYVKFVIPT